MSKQPITVVGGGIAGLVAAITCAEEGCPVKVLEARDTLGGRARSSDGPFVANFGAHALYRGRRNYAWLKERGLLPKVVINPPRKARFHYKGKVRRTPPAALLKGVRLAGKTAPVDQSFGAWATSALGEEAARLLARMAAVFTFHHDPRELSASFVVERLKWVYLPPSVRHVAGGWSVMIDGLAARARKLGAEIETGHKVETLPDGIVIVATELAGAAKLLANHELTWTGGDAAVLDVGLQARRGDPAAVVDLDHGMLIERQDTRDPSVAPDGHALYQCHVGLKSDDKVDDGVGRIEAVLDASVRDWREREVWRRRMVVRSRTGALDPPGATWRDRPSIEQGDGRFLAGDMVAADGLLSEVSFLSGIQAAKLAMTSAGHPSPTVAEGARRANMDRATRAGAVERRRNPRPSGRT